MIIIIYDSLLFGTVLYAKCHVCKCVAGTVFVCKVSHCVCECVCVAPYGWGSMKAPRSTVLPVAPGPGTHNTTIELQNKQNTFCC